MTVKTRKTRYGLPVTPAVPADNSTPYGALRFRTPWRPDEFAGPKGSPIYAGILDIDGTLQDFGTAASKKVLDWMKTVEKRHPKMVWLVVTARTHEYDYQRSFDWLVKHVPSAFIGPFHRAADDPRYASEFKRELAQGFEDIGLYKIVAAADDNEHVIKMWKHWAETHFASADEFDLLETSYSIYSGGYSSRYGFPTQVGKWQVNANHRPAGTRSFADDFGWDEFDRWEGRDEQAERNNARLDLEDDVYASYPDLGYDEIEKLDSEVLRQMLADMGHSDTGVA